MSDLDKLTQLCWMWPADLYGRDEDGTVMHEGYVREVTIDYEAGCKAMEEDSHGWLTCSDDGDLASFTVGVDAALRDDDTLGG